MLRSSYDNAIDAIEMSTLTFVGCVLDSVERSAIHSPMQMHLSCSRSPSLSLSLFLFLSIYLFLYLFPSLVKYLGDISEFLRLRVLSSQILLNDWLSFKIILKIPSYGLAQEYKSSRNRILSSR